MADSLGRSFIGIDASAEYINEIAIPRIMGDSPLFADPEVVDFLDAESPEMEAAL